MEIETLFEIKQEAFNGPIEVLLELIEKRKLFVNDISLASVTDDFISFIQKEGLQPEKITEFLSVAATLILIKARSLLPNIELTNEEHESIGNLERRVALYQIIRETSLELIRLYGKKSSFRSVPLKNEVVFAPDVTLDQVKLGQILANLLEQAPKPEPARPETRIKINISISEIISSIEARVEKMLSCDFNQIVLKSPEADDKSQKVYTIVSFLAMLELVRRGLLMAEQNDQFQNIKLASNKTKLSPL